MTLWTRRKLDSLPYDILFQITSILYVKEKRCLGGCGKFTATWVLSRVSRRLRAVALYFMFRNVNLSIHKELATPLEDFLPGGRYEHMAFSVRSLTMWTLDYTYYDWCSEMPVLSLRSADFPLVNLTALEMPHLIIEDTLVTALSHCEQLCTLAIACDESWPSSMLQRLSRLSTIRLYIVGETDLLGPEPVTTTATTSDPESPLVSYPLITTLAIYSLSLGPPHLIRECIKTCSFPNLTVFAVQNFESGNLAGLFHFIHQHPTLHEVNVDARRTTRIRVEAIMKLVDGTGTWVATNDVSGIKLSTIGYPPRQTEPPDLFPPNIVPGNQVFCSSFAFTRAPLPENDRPNISCARYRCISLAMHRLAEDPGVVEEDEELAVIRVLEHLTRVVPELEELRLSVIDLTCTSDHMDWTDALVDNVLINFENLRKLALYWDDNRRNHKPRWGYQCHVSPYESQEDRYIPLLDDAQPPLDKLRTRAVKTLSLCDLMYSDRCPRLVEEVAAGVRKVFELSEDEELDSFDDTLLMRAWAARNQDYADWTAETIAFMCPKLVQFDWYFLSDRHYILTTPRDHQRVVWSWRIERGKKGPYVMGNLRWTGCLSGDPRPMYPLVGQELERAMELGDRAWVPLV